MKNKILFTLGVIICFICTITVKAAEVTKTGMGYYWYITGNNYDKYYIANYYYVDGVDAYCLDPDAHEGGPLEEGDLNTSGIPDDVKMKVLLIAHYGYNYPGHQTLEYRAATQALIWEAVKPGMHVDIFTGKSGTGDELDISKERGEINRLISMDEVTPSFSDDDYYLQVGQTITLEDTNQILSNYDVVANNIDYSVDGNKLIITPINDTDINFSFNKRQVYNTPYKIFISEQYQNLLTPGIVSEVSSNMEVSGYYGRVDLNKYDIETNQRKNISVKGAVYGLYRKETDELVTKLIIDESGNASSGEILTYGLYYLKELVAPIGYKVDENIYEVDSRGYNMATISVPEEVIKGRIKLIKLDTDTNSCTSSSSSIFLEGAQYQIFDEDDNLIDTLDISYDCISLSQSLPYGRYKIKEVSAPRGYKLDENEYFVNIETDEVIIEVIVSDEPIKNHIVILKQYGNILGNTDFIEGESGIIFEYFNNGLKVGQAITDENGYIYLDLPYGNYEFKQINAKDGYEKMATFNITIDENSDEIQYYNIINNALSAYLKVVKIDADNKKNIKVHNVGFKIFNLDTNEFVKQKVGMQELDTFYTDENGIMMTYTKLKSGRYKLIEVDSPPGYMIDTNELYFEINDDTNFMEINNDKVLTIFFENKPIKGIVNINKWGEIPIINNNITYDKIPLQNIKFRIYADEDIYDSDKTILYSKGKLLDTLITDENGHASSRELPLGRYYLVETKTLDSYALDSEKYYFEINDTDHTTPIIYYEFELVNYLKKGKVELTKIDKDNNRRISGTKVALYTINDELIGTGITDDSGKVTIDNLPLGKYYFKEIESSIGYILSDEKIYFEIVRAKQNVKIEMNNEKMKGNIKIIKTDEFDKPLSNVQINIYDYQNNLIYEGTTNLDGIIETKLAYGHYYLLETKANEGYKISTEKIYFEIKDEEPIVIKLKNEKIKSLIKIKKIDNKNNQLEGVTIGIYDLDNNLIYENVTDENGIIETNLEYGKYYYKEIETIDGYIINEDKVYFEVINDEPLEFTLVNDLVHVDVPDTFKNNSFNILYLLILIGMIGVKKIF